MPEFRLYYDDTGKVLFYSCEKDEGNFIIIDAATYAECRHDIKVQDGKIVKINTIAMISKLVQSSNGISCHKDDISIISSENAVTWKIKNNEQN